MPALRLQLLIGEQSVEAAPATVVRALRNVEVSCSGETRDGMQATFGLGNGNPAVRDALTQEHFAILSRVVLVLDYGVDPYVLFDGVVTHHQMNPSSSESEASFIVTAESLLTLLDLEDRNMSYPNQCDSDIVTRILGGYSQYGIEPDVTATSDTPSASERTPSQHATDLHYVQDLAQRNGHVFYIEPDAPGTSRAHWGPEDRGAQPQRPLTVGMHGYGVLDSLRFGFRPLSAEQASATVLRNGTPTAVTSAGAPSSPHLAQRTHTPVRTTRLRSAGNLEYGAASAALATREAATARSTVTAQGELDFTRYGAVLRPRRPVAVRGAGSDYDGIYYVQDVTCQLKPGQCKQTFTLAREGLGASVDRVQP